MAGGVLWDTLQGTRFHLSPQTGKGTSSSNIPWEKDMLVPRRVCFLVFFLFDCGGRWSDTTPAQEDSEKDDFLVLEIHSSIIQPTV